MYKMMKIRLLDKVICRTPAFSVTDTLPDSLAELKLKIAESSLGFADFIQSVGASDLPHLEERVWFTLWKYFNRAKYRSTPFGSFAAISITPLATMVDTAIVINSKMDRIHLVDWSYKEDVQKDWRQRVDDETLFLTNSSIYHIGDEVRYLRIKDNVHELAAVLAVPILLTTIEICSVKISYLRLCELLSLKFDFTKHQLQQFIFQLVELQVLTCAILPNITGADYFERINFRRQESPSDYIIAKRSINSGSFDATALKNIPDLFAFFARHIPQPINRDLENFKTNFMRRFEHQEVSLSIALDPEIGISYGSSAQTFGSNELIEEFKVVKSQRNDPSIEYGDLQVFLLQHMINGETIQLEKFQSTVNEQQFPLPNTLSTLFHLYRNRPVILMAGGCTATALLGRFTLNNNEAAAFAKEISKVEVDANPEICFFDVAYQAENRVDNVNRRQQIYASELPILSWSTSTETLTFDDILISVQQNEVVLRSKSGGKRLVPRIPSAYNYSRSDLAAFRLLCDLQHQGLQTELSCRLRDFFPGLNYYPRINFKEIVVSPATWLLPHHIQDRFKKDDPFALQMLQGWFNEQQIDFLFKAGEADHQLCFDPLNTEDLAAFAIHCKQQPQNFYIVEALIDSLDHLKDEQGKTYVPQYIASYQHHEPLYSKSPSVKKSVLAPERVYLPGGEWLYFEIYTHPARSNELLINQLVTLKEKHKKAIKKWFFIRYTDSGPHIRWRLHLRDNTIGLQIMQELQEFMRPEINRGSVSEIKIRSYIRETERYGADAINLVEHFFYIDSNYVIFLLKKAKKEEQLLASSLKMIERFVALFSNDINGQVKFASEMADRFAREMAIGPEQFKKLNASFNLIKWKIEELAIGATKPMIRAYESAISALLMKIESEERQERLLADLIHMHLNRVFTVDQRMYETIIYHYLKRHLQTRRATGTFISVQKNESRLP